MIDELMDLLKDFPGAANRTRCFNHVIALVAKQIVRRFDVPQKKNDKEMDDAERDLQELAEGQDIEEAIMQRECEINENDENDANDDELDGWARNRETLSAEDRKLLDNSIRPVQMLLVKVHPSQPS
jgi:hypothetical protein